MNTDFIRQQTTLPEKKYGSNVLIGNWQEEKCDPNNKYNNFYHERKFGENQYNSTTLNEIKFMESKSDWMQFRDTESDHFVTMNMQEYKNPKDQKRTSELNKFVLKKSVFEKNPQLVEQYRDKYFNVYEYILKIAYQTFINRWTKATHTFDRTYLGQTGIQSFKK